MQTQKSTKLTVQRTISGWICVNMPFVFNVVSWFVTTVKMRPWPAWATGSEAPARRPCKSWRAEGAWCLLPPTWGFDWFNDQEIRTLEIKHPKRINTKKREPHAMGTSCRHPGFFIAIGLIALAPFNPHFHHRWVGPGRSSNHALSSASISSSPYRCWGLEFLKTCWHFMRFLDMYETRA